MENIIRKEIDRIASEIRKIISPERLMRLKDARIVRFEMEFKDGGGLAALIEGLTTEQPKLGKRYIVRVGIPNKPFERLTTLIHEMVHIPFIEFRRVSLASEYDYLEQTIDAIAIEFVENNRQWVEEKFEEWFGIRHTDFVIEE